MATWREHETGFTASEHRLAPERKSKEFSPDQLREKLLTVVCAGAKHAKRRPRLRPLDLELCANFIQPSYSELKRRRALRARDDDDRKVDDDVKRVDDDLTPTPTPTPPVTPTAAVSSAAAAQVTVKTDDDDTTTSLPSQTLATSLATQTLTGNDNRPFTTLTGALPLATVTGAQASSPSTSLIAVISSQTAPSSSFAVAALTTRETSLNIQTQTFSATTMRTSARSQSPASSSVSAAAEITQAAPSAKQDGGGGGLSPVALVGISFSISLLVVLVIGSLIFRKRKVLFSRWSMYRARRRGSSGDGMSISNPILRPLTANDALSEQFQNGQMTFAPKEKDALFAPKPKRRTMVRIRELLSSPLTPLQRFSRRFSRRFSQGNVPPRESPWSDPPPNVPKLSGKYSSQTRGVPQMGYDPPLPAVLKSYMSTASSYKSEVPIGYDGESTPRFPRNSTGLFPPPLAVTPANDKIGYSLEAPRYSGFQFSLSNNSGDTVQQRQQQRRQQQQESSQDSTRASETSFGTSNLF